MTTRLNPYVGPRPFTAGEMLPARHQEVLGLRRALISARILVFHSQSGAGKTSLLEAGNGLRRAMSERDFLVHPTARVHQAPPAGLAHAVNRYELSALQTLAGAADIAPERLAEFGLAGYLDSLCSDSAAAGDPAPDPSASHSALRPTARRRELLIFDQFEEILTTDPLDERGRGEFFERLALALADPYRWALFVLREDYLGALEPWATRLPTHLAHHFRIDLLPAGGARAAICEPGAEQGVTFTADALDHLVDELRRVNIQGLDGRMETRHGAWIEPVQLQVVCHRLWSGLAPDEQRIELEQIRTKGDVDAALGDFYGEQVAAIAVAHDLLERLLRDWIGRRLISPQGFRTPVTRGADGMDAILEALEMAHLVRGEERHGVKWYELAHDRLVAPIRASNEAWEWDNLHPIQMQALLWERRGEPRELMLSDDALANGETWADANFEALTAKEQIYVERSREQASTRTRERQAAKALASAQSDRLAKQARSLRRLAALAALLGLGWGVTTVLGAVRCERWRAAEARASTLEAGAKEPQPKTDRDRGLGAP